MDSDFKSGLLIGGVVAIFIAIWASWSVHEQAKEEYCANPPEPLACCQAVTNQCIACNQESQKRIEQYKNMCE